MKPTFPRVFTMVRNADKSGVSGTGRVLDGVVFHNGQVVVCWRTDIDAAKHGDSSIGIYPSWEAFKHIHISSHPDNKTEIIWSTRNKRNKVIDRGGIVRDRHL